MTDPIQNRPRVGPAARTSRPAAASAFRVPGDSEQSSAAGETAATAPPHDVTLAGLLALQEGEVESPQDRTARRHGHRLLDRLVRLQHALLGGPLDSADLTDLAQLAEAVPPATDPRLAAAMQDIALRARVELARVELARFG